MMLEQNEMTQEAQDNIELQSEIEALKKINADQAKTINSLKRALGASEEELATLLKAIRIVKRHETIAGISDGFVLNAHS